MRTYRTYLLYALLLSTFCSFSQQVSAEANTPVPMEKSTGEEPSMLYYYIGFAALSAFIIGSMMKRRKVSYEDDDW